MNKRAYGKLKRARLTSEFLADKGRLFPTSKSEAKSSGKRFLIWQRNQEFQRGQRFETEPQTLGYMDANLREHRGSVRITDRQPTWLRKGL